MLWLTFGSFSSLLFTSCLAFIQTYVFCNVRFVAALFCDLPWRIVYGVLSCSSCLPAIQPTVGAVLSQSIRKTLRSDPSLAYEAGITVGKLLRVHCDGDLRKEIKSRCFFYRNATLIRSGIVTIDVPYNMSYSDLGDFCCELDHMVLDYVAGLQTKLEEIMDSARCYTPKVDMDSVILPKKMKDLVLQRAENFDIFRRLRKEVRFFFLLLRVFVFCF